MAIRRWLAVAMCLSTLPAAAVDWPQWRGPDRNGISQETGLLKQWPSEGPKLLWQAKAIDEGYSTPAIVGDRIYLLSNKGMEDEFVQALSVEDGQQLWTVRIGNVGKNDGPQYPGSRSTPTVDGEMLYALGSDGDLACVEVAGGKIRWQKSLRSDFGGVPGKWAYSESPLVDGNKLVCTPGGKDATIVALDKKSGDAIWKCALEEADEAAYASAIVVEAGGVKQYVQFLQKGVVGVDAETGEKLWRYEKTAQGSPANIPTPVAHDAFVYSASNRGGGGLVELKTSDKGIEPAEIYAGPKLPTSIGGTVRDWRCTVWHQLRRFDVRRFRDRRAEMAGPLGRTGRVCYAEGMLYVHGEGGDVALGRGHARSLSRKGSLHAPRAPEHGKAKAWAYPVVANGRLYIRDWGTLWSYDVSTGGK